MQLFALRIGISEFVMISLYLGKPAFLHATTTFLTSNLHAGQHAKPLHWFQLDSTVVLPMFQNLIATRRLK